MLTRRWPRQELYSQNMELNFPCHQNLGRPRKIEPCTVLLPFIALVNESGMHCELKVETSPETRHCMVTRIINSYVTNKKVR